MEQPIGNFISPDTLGQYAMDTIIENYQRSFAMEIFVPSKISNAVFAAYQRKRGILDEDFLKIFSLPHVGKLTEIHLMRCSIEEKNVQYISTLVTESVRVLSLYSEAIPQNFLHHLNRNGKNLEVFSISGRLFQSLFDPCFKCESGDKAYKAWSWILKAPKLKFFCVKWNQYEHHDWSENYYDGEFLPKLLTYFKELKRLEIGGNPFLRVMALDHKEFFEIIQSNIITSLIFNDVFLEDSNFQAIESLKNLEHLDISSLEYKPLYYVEPGKKLKSFVVKLEKLKSLDISGTNLDEPDENVPPEIYGLKLRKNNPLEFLGLYHTRKEMCRYLNIPANKISGHWTIKQLTTTARMYSGSMKIARRWLDDFANLHIGSDNVVPALQILLEYMAQLLDFGFEREFVDKAMPTLHWLSTRRNLNFAIKWASLKSLFNICARSDCPHESVKNHICRILSHLLVSSRELNYFIQPFINLIFRHLKDTPPCYNLALHFSRISDEHQKRLFVDQDGMLEMMESYRGIKMYTNQIELFRKTMQNLINENSEMAGRFLENGVNLFSDSLPNMVENRWDDAITAAAKVFVRILIQSKDLNVLFFAKDQFLENLIEAFTKDYRSPVLVWDHLPEWPSFYLGFILAQFLSMENFRKDFGRRNRNKVVKAFRVIFGNHQILDYHRMVIGDDLIDPLMDLMRRKDIPECKSLAIWEFSHIIRNCNTQKRRDLILRNRVILKLSLDDFVAKYGAKYPNITDFAEILRHNPLICGD